MTSDVVLPGLCFIPILICLLPAATFLVFQITCEPSKHLMNTTLSGGTISIIGTYRFCCLYSVFHLWNKMPQVIKIHLIFLHFHFSFKIHCQLISFIDKHVEMLTFRACKKFLVMSSYATYWKVLQTFLTTQYLLEKSNCRMFEDLGGEKVFLPSKWRQIHFWSYWCYIAK